MSDIEELMDLDEAKRVIRDPEASFVAHVTAAAVLASDPASTYRDLLECLRYQGLPSETAATQLYFRTKRVRTDDSIMSVVLDYDDWELYLEQNKLI